MKKMLMVFVAGIVLFAASAGTSLYLRQNEAAHSDEKGAAAEKKVPGSQAAKSASENAAAPSTQPRPTTPSPENFVQMANALRQQQEALKAREQNLQTRQKHLDIVYQDLKNEQKRLEDVRKEIGAEMQALGDRLDQLEHKSTDINKEKRKLTEQANEVKQTLFQADENEQKRIRQMAAMYDSMDADTAGDIFQQMADGGKMDMAVKILAMMQERQAAHVLTQMPDRATVVQILDRMKGLKKTSSGQ